MSTRIGQVLKNATIVNFSITTEIRSSIFNDTLLRLGACTIEQRSSEGQVLQNDAQFLITDINIVSGSNLLEEYEFLVFMPEK